MAPSWLFNNLQIIIFTATDTYYFFDGWFSVGAVVTASSYFHLRADGHGQHFGVEWEREREREIFDGEMMEKWSVSKWNYWYIMWCCVSVLRSKSMEMLRCRWNSIFLSWNAASHASTTLLRMLNLTWTVRWWFVLDDATTNPRMILYG